MEIQSISTPVDGYSIEELIKRIEVLEQTAIAVNVSQCLILKRLEEHMSASKAAWLKLTNDTGDIVTSFQIMKRGFTFGEVIWSMTLKIFKVSGVVAGTVITLYALMQLIKSGEMPSISLRH